MSKKRVSITDHLRVVRKAKEVAKAPVDTPTERELTAANVS